MLARQRRFEALFHQLLARPAHRGEAGFQRLHDLAVAPSFTRAGRIGLQQDTRLHQKLRGALAGADQFMQMPAFVAGQFHDVLFLRLSLWQPRIASGNWTPGDGLTNQTQNQ